MPNQLPAEPWPDSKRPDSKGTDPTGSDSDGSSPADSAQEAPEREDLSFDAIYEHWFDDVSRWVRAMGGPDADRDDLVQDVFVIVHRRLPDFDGQNVAGWLYKIAKRRVRDFRRLLWFKHLVVGRAPMPEGVARPEPSPADSLESKEQGAIIERLLDALNPDQRAAFVLFEVEGLSGEEIAHVQGVPLNTVWARIRTARKKLQQRLVRLSEREHRRLG